MARAKSNKQYKITLNYLVWSVRKLFKLLGVFVPFVQFVKWGKFEDNLAIKFQFPVIQWYTLLLPPPHIHLFLVIYMPRCMQEGPSYISLDTLIWNQIPAVSQIECQIPPLFKSPCANAASLSERLIPCRRPCLRVSCVYPIRKKLKQLAQFQWKLRIQYFCCVS